MDEIVAHGLPLTSEMHWRIDSGSAKVAVVGRTGSMLLCRACVNSHILRKGRHVELNLELMAAVAPIREANWVYNSTNSMCRKALLVLHLMAR
jgi:hypothetical protein